MSETIQRSFLVSRVFTPTAPVDVKSLFAGRLEQLGQVIDAVNQKGQHVIIFGERGVGKTSLVNVLAEFLPMVGGRPAVTPRVNCDSSDSYATLFDKIFREVQLVQQTNPLGFNAEAQKRSIDATSFLTGGITPDNVRRALTVLAGIVLPILIFDEFDRLPEDVKRAMADTVKSLSDHGVDATIIMVGVADTVSELIAEHASVERAMVQVPMPRMSDAEILQIVDNGCEKLALEITEDARQMLKLLSQGLPHYTHLICLHACRKTIDAGENTVTPHFVRIAIDRSVANAQHSISSSYHRATMSPRKDNLFSDVLLACALAPADQMGFFAAQDVRTPMQEITGKDYQIPSFAQHLNEFSDEKRGPILKKIGTPRSYRFRFINPLLQPYVIMQGCISGKVKL